MQQQPAKLTLNQLTFERNNYVLFANIHCTLQAGELLQIQGANGSGKSTLLRILAGLLEPNTGCVLWEEQPITQQYATYQQQLHYLGHQNGVKNNLTAQENLALSCALLAIKLTNYQINDILQQVGLQHFAQTKALHLSAGQLRRLALARLLLTPSQLWILDEPTTALDSAGQQLLAKMITQHLANGGIVALATHAALPLTSPMQTIHLGKHYAV